MKILIDPSGGIAGDMFSALLISAGAPEKKIIDGMILAASKLGIADITSSKTNDGSSRLNIHFHSKHAHIKGTLAKKLLVDLFKELHIEQKYQDYGNKALEILIDAERKAHSENHFESDHYHFNPIGVVKTPYVNDAPFSPEPNAKGEFYIELFPKYADGLAELDKFSHVHVIVYLDKSIGYSLMVKPPHYDNEVGVFASRSPFRPNPIGLNIVEIKKIKKNKIFISPVDFLNNTPLIDIKPVIKKLDKVDSANNGWLMDKHQYNSDLEDKKQCHHHQNKKHEHGDAYLHEAQDIIIDIIGAVIGMQSLKLDTAANLVSPVSIGGGMVKFSHGKLPVPSPATRIILEKYNIPYKKGPINTELCTPTGAAILAALDLEYNNVTKNIIEIGKARGTKDLEIPPLKICKPKES